MKMLWFIPTHGDSRYLGTAHGARTTDLAYFKQVAVAADTLGYEGVLIPTGRSCEDPWIVAAGLLSVTERLSKAVTALHLSTGLTPLTLSIGISEAVPHDDLASLLARADKALYKAKSDGRNCRRIYTELDEKSERLTDLRSPVLIAPANSSLLPQ